jgi:uncharacterized protein (TIGR03437 family)
MIRSGDFASEDVIRYGDNQIQGRTFIVRKFASGGYLPAASRILLPVVAIGVVFGAAPMARAQGSILGSNLIVNGDAEGGALGTTIPGWTNTGNSTVAAYGSPGPFPLTAPAPPDHKFQYFAAGSSTSTLTQSIDVSSGASTIGAGNVKFTAAAYLGDIVPTDYAGSAQVIVAFENSKGQTFSTATLGPLPGGAFAPGHSTSLFFQQQIGLVPSGTTTIVVTLTLTSFNGGYGAADSLSLVLTTLGTSPATILGSNLVVNPGAEAGPGNAYPAISLYLPSWSTASGFPSAAPYGGTGWIATTAPGPPDRGTNVIWGSSGTGMYQDVDVSAAASLIDAGSVQFEMSAWLGAYGDNASPALTYAFFDWSGTQLATTGQLTGPGNVQALALESAIGLLPHGTRRVRIALSFPGGSGVPIADNISLVIGAPGAPIITSESTVPVYSSATNIQPGSWISIYGTGLAASTMLWNGDFPTQLDGTTVTIDGKAAYLWFVSANQINAQAPDDTATGPVQVVVTTSAGSSSSTVALAQYAPSFSLFNGKYPAAVVATPGAPGNSGNGYDYIGPAGAFSFPSRPVKAGETILLYGVGFGPTTQPVPAGSVFSGASPCVALPTVTIGGVSATVSFAGIVEAGLYQFNVVVPNAGSGDKALSASVGGVTTPANVLITLQ